MNRSVSLKIALVLSLLIHIAAFLSLLLLVPDEKKERKTPFMASLVAPDEIESGPAGRRGRSLPGVPSQPKVPAVPKKPRPPSPIVKKVPLPEEKEKTSPPPSRPGSETAVGGAEKSAPSAPGAGPGGFESERGAKEGHGKERDGKKSSPSPSVRERLFDREVIEKFAKREETKEDTGITFETEEFRYRTYMMRLKEKIENIWKYPPDAAMLGIYGDLYIRFTIKKNGALGDMELIRTSGHRSLDEAAQQALRDAQPFWPLPREWGREDLPITGHFVYSIYGTYIR